MALPGALLQDGKKLRARNWRGERSAGMLCSWAEWQRPDEFSPAADRVCIAHGIGSTAR